MPILKANKIKLANAQTAARLNTLDGWRAKHARACRWQWLDVTIGEYAHWRCSCGMGFVDPPRDVGSGSSGGSITWTTSL